MNRRKTIFIAVPILIIGLFVLFRGSAKMDRVDQHFAEASQLNETAVSWLPFKKLLLNEAKDISIASDVDTNQFVIRLRFVEAEAFYMFQTAISKLSNHDQIVDCAKTKRFECEAMGKAEGNILLSEISQKIGVFNKSLWILDPNNNRVIGSTHIPLPPHLK